MTFRSSGTTSFAVRQHLDPALLSDPVIRREDGSWLYMLPSVVDDVDMGVTHVVRGEDHVTNTGLQLQMFDALGAEPPAFAHEALLVGSEGKLAKRLGSLGVEAMREAGIEPIALDAKLARIGTSLPVEPVTDSGPLIEAFDFATFGRAPARFDLDELDALNARILHLLPFAEVEDRLPAGMAEADWAAIRPNLRSVAEAADWWEILHGHVEQVAAEEDRPLIAQAAAAAGEIDWGEAPWPQLVARLKETSGRSGKAAVPAAAPRPHRPRQRSRNGGPAAPDRPRRDGRPPALRRRLNLLSAGFPGRQYRPRYCYSISSRYNVSCDSGRQRSARTSRWRREERSHDRSRILRAAEVSPDRPGAGGRAPCGGARRAGAGEGPADHHRASDGGRR